MEPQVNMALRLLCLLRLRCLLLIKKKRAFAIERIEFAFCGESTSAGRYPGSERELCQAIKLGKGGFMAGGGSRSRGFGHGVSLIQPGNGRRRPRLTRSPRSDASIPDDRRAIEQEQYSVSGFENSAILKPGQFRGVLCLKCRKGENYCNTPGYLNVPDARNR